MLQFLSPNHLQVNCKLNDTMPLKTSALPKHQDILCNHTTFQIFNIGAMTQSNRSSFPIVSNFPTSPVVGWVFVVDVLFCFVVL
jgi:hypothetical protein